MGYNSFFLQKSLDSSFSRRQRQHDRDWSVHYPMPHSCLSAVGDHSYNLALIKHPGTTIHIRGTYSARWDFFSFLPGIGAVPGITNTSSLRAFFLARLCRSSTLIFSFPLVLGARRLILLLIASTGTWIRLGTNPVIPISLSYNNKKIAARASLIIQASGLVPGCPNRLFILYKMAFWVRLFSLWLWSKRRHALEPFLYTPLMPWMDSYIDPGTGLSQSLGRQSLIVSFHARSKSEVSVGH